MKTRRQIMEPTQVDRFDNYLKVLNKYRKLIGVKVAFSDVSPLLLKSGVVDKDLCFIICSLPREEQMGHLLDHFVENFRSLQGMFRGNNGYHATYNISCSVPESNISDTCLWRVIINSLNTRHRQIARKLFLDFRKLEGSKKKIRKVDISSPTNFNHIHHFGKEDVSTLERSLTESKGHPPGFRYEGKNKKRPKSNRTTENSFIGEEIDLTDPDMLIFLERSGVTQRHLNTPRTRELILNFIRSNGGIEAIRAELRRTSNPNRPTAGGTDADNNSSDSSDYRYNCDDDDNFSDLDDLELEAPIPVALLHKPLAQSLECVTGISNC